MVPSGWKRLQTFIVPSQVPVALAQVVTAPLQTKEFGWIPQEAVQHDAVVPLLAPSSQDSIRSGFASASILLSPQSE